MKNFSLFVLFPVIGVFTLWAFTFFTHPEASTDSPLNSARIETSKLANPPEPEGFVITNQDRREDAQVAWGPQKQGKFLFRLMHEEGIDVSLSFGHGIAGIYVPSEQIEKAVDFLNDPAVQGRFPKMKIGRLDN